MTLRFNGSTQAVETMKYLRFLPNEELKYLRFLPDEEPKKTKKPVIYIAGAYKSDKGEFYVRANIREAENCALEVWRAGGIALCPHKNTAGLGGAFGLPESTWLDGDLELLRRCDAIYMVPNWVASPGAQNEKQHAEEWSMPVLLNFGELLEFIQRWRENHEDT